MSSLCNVSNFLHLIGSISIFQCTFFSASIPFKMKIDPIFVFESENIIENVFQKKLYSQKKREDDRRSNRAIYGSANSRCTLIPSSCINYCVMFTLELLYFMNIENIINLMMRLILDFSFCLFVSFGLLSLFSAPQLHHNNCHESHKKREKILFWALNACDDDLLCPFALCVEKLRLLSWVLMHSHER